MGRDHSCEGCGRGGFNDPDGKCCCMPDEPTIGQIADLLNETYTAEGVAIFLFEGKNHLRTIDGRRELYRRALALAEGVFS